MAIAPEMDHRYRRLYAGLQSAGKVSDKLTPNLAIELLCHKPEDKQAALRSFDSNATLFRTGLLSASDSQYPLLSRPIHLHSAILQHLLEPYCADGVSLLAVRGAQLSWLAPRCAIAATLAAAMTGSPLLPALVKQIQQRQIDLPLILHFVGTGAKQRAAEAIASAAGYPLLQLDLAQLTQNWQLEPAEVVRKLREILLQGRLWNAVLFLEGLSTLGLQQTKQKLSSSDTIAIQESLFRLASEHPGIVIFSGSPPLNPSMDSEQDIATIPFMCDSRG